MAVANRWARGRRRRIHPTRPRLASRAAWGDVAVSGSLPGVRVRIGHCDRCGSHRGPGRHFDSARGRRPRCLVDVSSRDAIRCCWRSRAERGHDRCCRRGLTHAALGRKDRQAYVHRSNSYDAWAPAPSPLGRRVGTIASCELPNTVCYHRRDNASPPAGLRRGGAPADRSRSDERYPRGCSAE